MGLIFDKDGLKGICDVDFNILVEVKFNCLSEISAGINGIEGFSAYMRDDDGELIDSRWIFVYNEAGELPELINEYYPLTESIEFEPFSLEIGNSIALTAKGTVYIDPNNHNVVPVLENERALVPMRFITEQVHGANVYWDDSERKATFSIPGRSVMVWENSFTVILKKFNEKTREFDEFNYYLDVPARITNGRTFVPLRAVSELLGIDVDFDDDTGIITIKNGTGK